MRNNVKTGTVADARKENWGKKEALELAKSVKEIYSCKGSKITEINMAKDKPGEQTLLDAMLGPTGNLRAPTMRVGDVLLVGFNEDVFKTKLRQLAKAK